MLCKTSYTVWQQASKLLRATSIEGTCYTTLFIGIQILMMHGVHHICVQDMVFSQRASKCLHRGGVLPLLTFYFLTSYCSTLLPSRGRVALLTLCKLLFKSPTTSIEGACCRYWLLILCFILHSTLLPSRGRLAVIGFVLHTSYYTASIKAACCRYWPRASYFLGHVRTSIEGSCYVIGLVLSKLQAVLLPSRGRVFVLALYLILILYYFHRGVVLPLLALYLFVAISMLR